MGTRCGVVLLLALLAGGCMQTRHVETRSVSTCCVGGTPSAAHDATYSERSWCGFWPFQPARVQP